MSSTLSKTFSRQSQRNNLSQARSADPLFGHLGHLSEAQEHALTKFKILCAEKRLYSPASENQPASHDDATLLRFLRARKFDIHSAFGQFKDTEEWRAANQLDALYEHIDVESYEKARAVYPQWTGHRDRRGIPLYVYVIKHLDSKYMAKYSEDVSTKTTAVTHAKSTVPRRLLRLFALYENLLRFALPLCSSLDRPNPECPITSTTNIVDISGVGLKQFWNLKGHMQDASVLATAHYPETLERIFIIGAPAFFPTVWSWIKRWFDPVTVSKIFILSAADVKPTLTSFIDPSGIPKKYGGDLDWDFGMLPQLDPQLQAAMGELGPGEQHKWIKGPVLWENGKRLPVGRVGGKDRREQVAAGQVEMNEKPLAKPAPDLSTAPILANGETNGHVK